MPAKTDELDCELLPKNLKNEIQETLQNSKSVGLSGLKWQKDATSAVKIFGTVIKN